MSNFVVRWWRVGAGIFGFLWIAGVALMSGSPVAVLVGFVAAVLGWWAFAEVRLSMAKKVGSPGKHL